MSLRMPHEHERNLYEVKAMKNNDLSAAAGLLVLKSHDENSSSSSGYSSPSSTTTNSNAASRKIRSPHHEPHLPSKRMNFSITLFDIIEDEDNADIIHWVLDGKAFIIADKKRFEQEILPQYFKGTKFPSFTRKLIRWGFHRVPRGTLIGAYYHKHFQKASPDLCRLMSCGNRHQNHEPAPHNHKEQQHKTLGPNVRSPPSRIVVQGDRVMPISSTIQDPLPKTAIFEPSLASSRNEGDMVVPLEDELHHIKNVLSQELNAVRMQQIQRLMKIRELEVLRGIQTQKSLNQRRAARLLYARERYVSRRNNTTMEHLRRTALLASHRRSQGSMHEDEAQVVSRSCRTNPALHQTLQDSEDYFLFKKYHYLMQDTLERKLLLGASSPSVSKNSLGFWMPPCNTFLNPQLLLTLTSL